jgi:hypothetical protein
MGRLSPDVKPLVFPVEESVEIEYLDPADVEAEVGKLREPWIADEGPLDAELWRHPGGALKRPLLPRGLAFDDETTVAWDEDIVRVIRPAPPRAGVIARRSQVLIRFDGYDPVERVDYLERGVLLASRYQPGRPRGESDDA